MKLVKLHTPSTEINIKQEEIIKQSTPIQQRNLIIISNHPSNLLPNSSSSKKTIDPHKLLKHCMHLA